MYRIEITNQKTEERVLFFAKSMTIRYLSKGQRQVTLRLIPEFVKSFAKTEDKVELIIKDNSKETIFSLENAEIYSADDDCIINTYKGD